MRQNRHYTKMYLVHHNTLSEFSDIDSMVLTKTGFGLHTDINFQRQDRIG